MSRKKKPDLPIRAGKPAACVSCGRPLHRKSEYYCSQRCADVYRERLGAEAPAFLSKWKLRQRKERADPLIVLRKRIRQKTRELIKTGRLRKRGCAVCGARDVVPHHEDYRNPFQVIWLCEQHHKEYHDGKIALHDGTLWWDPQRLTEVGSSVKYPEKKYRLLRDAANKRTAERKSEQ